MTYSTRKSYTNSFESTIPAEFGDEIEVTVYYEIQDIGVMMKENEKLSPVIVEIVDKDGGEWNVDDYINESLIREAEDHWESERERSEEIWGVERGEN